MGVKVSSGGGRTIELVDSAALVAYIRTIISITMSSKSVMLCEARSSS